VFTTRARRPGDVLEVAPVLVLGDEADELLEVAALARYAWEWEGGAAIGLGLISLVNHGVPANARWESDTEAAELWLTAAAEMAAGDEVLVDYTDGGTRPLDFEPRRA
jgi:hypothetical protein